MRKYILMLVPLVMAACNGRVEIPIEPKMTASFSAFCADYTKVTIDDSYTLHWDEGDQIMISDGVKSVPFTATGKGACVNFESEGMILSASKTYYAAFPFKASSLKSGNMIVNLPDRLTLAPGKYPDAPAVAVTDGTERILKFKNICGVVSFDVSSKDIKSVTIEGLNSEVIAGSLLIDDPSLPAWTVKDGLGSVSLVSDKGLVPGKYYMALLPGEFANGIRLTMVKTDDSSITRDYEPFALGRSMYIDLEKIDEGRFLRYVITDADQLQQFLQDAPLCKPYVTATLADNIDLAGVALSGASSYAGVFDGNGCSLQNWNCTEPLFGTLEPAAHLENLNIASNCRLSSEAAGSAMAYLVLDNHGAISNCINNAGIDISSCGSDFVCAGIAAFSDGTIDRCINKGDIAVHGNARGVAGVVAKVSDNTGSVTLNSCSNEGVITVDAAFAGGIFAISEGGTVRGCNNNGDIRCEAAAQVDSLVIGGLGAFADSNLESCTNSGMVSLSGTSTEKAFVGGIAGHFGESAVTTGLHLMSCVNDGAVSCNVASPVTCASGIAAWASGAVSDNTKNNGSLTISHNNSGVLYAGGIIGQSLYMFNKVYNYGALTVELGSEGGQVLLGGVAGYMSGSGSMTNAFTTGQNSGKITLQGGAGNTSADVFHVAGVVANTDINNVYTTKTSWAETNTNYGDIEVNVPLTVYVGGIYGRVKGTGVTASTKNVGGCKNAGNILVTNPGKDSCIGGIIARHGRGCMGNANMFGDATKYKPSITVTGGNESVCVGSYAGWVSSDNGNNYPSCCVYISGFKCYGSIDAPGTTAGVLVGKTQLTGNSTSNGIMLGTAASERPSVSRSFTLNGVQVNDVSSSQFSVGTFLGKIVPSSTTTKTKTDGSSLKNVYYFCAGGSTSAEVTYKDGILSVD